MNRRFYLALLLLIAACIEGFNTKAQESVLWQLDSFYTSKSDNHKLMGNVLILADDSIIYKKSYGYQDIEKNTPNTDSSEFAMASVTKIFTATAILQLKEKKLLDPDDDYVKYFPDFPFPDITLRELLSHTSGLPAYELFIDSLVEALPKKIFGNEDVTPALKVWDKPLHNDPGEGYSYSSMNYCLLALLVEKLSGMSLPDYFSKYIFVPAGMEHSYLENYNTIRQDKNRTVNYETRSANSSQLVNVYDLPRERKMVYNCGGFMGQGGLITTTEDMARFDKAYFSGKLLKFTSMEEATTPTMLKDGRPVVASTILGSGIAGYGLGWQVGVHPALGKIVWHTGGRPGIKTIYLHLITKNLTVFIFENVVQGDGINKLAAITLNILNSTPVFRER